MKTSLIICHNDNNTRIIKIEGKNSMYFAGPNESKIEVDAVLASEESLKIELKNLDITEVDVILASDELIRKGFKKLGITANDIPATQILAKKFASELIKNTNGKLALNKETGEFFEITAYGEINEKTIRKLQENHRE